MAAAGLLLNFHYENEGMRYEIRREVNTWREVRGIACILLWLELDVEFLVWDILLWHEWVR